MNCITDVKDKISKLIIKAYQHKASDLFIRENMYPYIRNSLGKIEIFANNLLFGFYRLFLNSDYQFSQLIY